jgi:hypothetical protein
MRTTARILRSTIVVLLSTPLAASAQSIAIYGGVEAAGYGEGSAVLGTTVSPGRLGVQPYLSLLALAYRYDAGASHKTANAFAPSVGLMYSTQTHSVQGGVGYVFAADASPRTTAGTPVGAEDSPFVTAQYSYWGDGSRSVNLLGSYTFEPSYVWTRASALGRLGPESRVFAGGEVGLQGSATSPSFWRIQAGPAFEYRVSNAFRIGGAAGVRFSAGQQSPPLTGYARLEFLALPGR